MAKRFFPAGYFFLLIKVITMNNYGEDHFFSLLMPYISRQFLFFPDGKFHDERTDPIHSSSDACRDASANKQSVCLLYALFFKSKSYCRNCLRKENHGLLWTLFPAQKNCRDQRFTISFNSEASANKILSRAAQCDARPSD